VRRIGYVKHAKMESKPRFPLKPKNCISTERLLELLHMDLFDPSITMSLGGNYYALVIVDDFCKTREN